MKTLRNLKPIYFALKATLVVTLISAFSVSIYSVSAYARDPFPAVVFAEGLHLRYSPQGDSLSLGVYDQGSQVEVLKYDPEWVKVRVNGQVGYMSRHYLTTPKKYSRAIGVAPIHTPSSVTVVSAGSAQAGSGHVAHVGPVPMPPHLTPGGLTTISPSTDNTAVADPSTANLNVLPPPNPNLRPPSAPVTPATPASTESNTVQADLMRVNATGLHLRRSGEAQAESLGVFPNGTEVRVVQNNPDSDWVLVNVDGKEGAMHRDYLQPASASTTPVPPANVPGTSHTMYVSSSNGLNLRQAADANSTVIRSLPVNGEVEVLSVSDGWAHVKTSSGEGYMWAEHLSDSRTQVAPTNVASADHCINSLEPKTQADLQLIEEVQRAFQAGSMQNTQWRSQKGVEFQLSEAGGLLVTVKNLPPTAKAQLALAAEVPLFMVDMALGAGSIQFNTTICRRNGRYVANLVGTNRAEDQSGTMEIFPSAQGVQIQGVIAGSQIERETYVSR